VHLSSVSGKRAVIIQGKENVDLVSSPGAHDSVIAKLKPNIRCALNKCNQNWCQVICLSHKGWVIRKHLWGVYPDE